MTKEPLSRDLDDVKYHERTRESREDIEVAEKEEKRNRIEYERDRDRLLARIDREKKLLFLRTLVEKGMIPVATIEHLMDAHELRIEEIETIFGKIDEIENIENIDRILPVSHRISRAEYADALTNHEERTHLLAKIDDALGYLYDAHGGGGMPGLSLFTGLLHILNRNLITVQGNMIDIKRSLQDTATR